MMSAYILMVMVGGVLGSLYLSIMLLWLISDGSALSLMNIFDLVLILYNIILDAGEY